MNKWWSWCALGGCALLVVNCAMLPAPRVEPASVAKSKPPIDAQAAIGQPAPPPEVGAFPAPPTGVIAPLAGSPNNDVLAQAALAPGTCAATPEAIRERAAPLIEQMRRDVDEEYQRYQENLPLCWESYRENEEYWRSLKSGEVYGVGGLGLSGIGEGGGGYGVGIGSGSVGSIGHGGLSGNAGVAVSVRTAKSRSGTNNQVADVDEADLVKTDGRYLYITLNGALRIVEALRPRVLSVTKLVGKVQDLFVENDRAVVYSRMGGNGAAGCKYGYDCSFGGDGSSTRITVLDVRDRSAPRVVRSIELSGSLLASRRIGNAVHTVVSDGDVKPPPYDTWMTDLPDCGVRDSAVRARVARLKERNERMIRESVRAWAPSIRDGGVERTLCDQVYASQFHDGEVFTTLVSFDVEQDAAPAAATTLRSRPGAVFAASDALYVSVAHTSPRRGRRSYRPFGDSVNEVSEVHKFHIGKSPQETRYVGSGVVPGHVLNQFSMDQWYGYLRIATSHGRVPDPKVESSVSVLADDGKGALVRVGAIEHMARGEDIRAVRFDNERGYVVTFKKTDPLFTLDLADPARPRLLGALKIPGFSTYMQRIDADHLISIGFDANDHGNFAYYDGLLLQLFNVHEPTDPKLLFREKIGTRGSGSEAATNHLAFNYFAERGLLAVPATVCDGGGDGTNGTSVTFSGLLVYEVDSKRGFKRLGGVDHGAHGSDCAAWWSRSSSAVKRSVFLDQLVYSIADDRVKAQHLARLGKDLADLDMSQ